MIETLDFEAVVTEHQNHVFNFALGLTGSRADAEDLAQEAFWRAYRATSDWPAERPLRWRPYLLKITLNLQRNRARARKNIVHLNGSEPSAGAGPEETAIARTRTRAVLSRIQSLPRHYREAVLLRYAHDLSYDEISSVLGRPLGTVKSDVHRGLALLKEGGEE